MEIRITRVRQSLTQGQLGAKAGYKKTVISELELGKHDSAILTYKRIVDASGMDMKDFL